MFKKRNSLKKFRRITHVPKYQLNKVAGLQLATLSKKRLWHRCFSVNSAEFLIAAFLHKTSGQLLHVFLI